MMASSADGPPHGSSVADWARAFMLWTGKAAINAALKTQARRFARPGRE